MKRKLSDMAFDVAMENIDSWDKNHVKKIIVPYRSKKLDLSWHEAKNHHLNCDGKGNHIDKLFATLPCLINSKMYKRFDITDWTEMHCKSSTLSNSRFQEFIRCLGSNTPNLEELMLSCPNGREYSLEKRELASIAQLRNLKKLNIVNVLVPLSGFLELTRQCDKLERIFVAKVGIDVEPSGDAFSDKFVFIDIDSQHERRLGLTLESTLPSEQRYTGFDRFVRLKLAPTRVDQISLIRGFTKVKEIMFYSHNLEDVETMDEFPHFPEVKFAHVHCKGATAHALRCFLKRNGQNLQELSLCGIDPKQNMTFAEVLTLSPHLTSFIIARSNLLGNDAPVEAMSRLTKFKWKGVYDESVDPVAFSSILYAPLLVDVNIDLPKIDFSDNDSILFRIRRREILQNIMEFQMRALQLPIFGTDFLLILDGASKGAGLPKLKPGDFGPKNPEISYTPVLSF
ncbi:Hypothetical predicted protein [Cloeon dipterum]|uniref:Uncharacterized protein n=1 Tax=Cloeon dipterum TaxID=197152 RepID=A0A8S1CWB6_9INSE|nr:Hypothetical predicted protein [Cloeon dipterum]